jgi:hypothetical protein
MELEPDRNFSKVGTGTGTEPEPNRNRAGTVTFQKSEPEPEHDYSKVGTGTVKIVRVPQRCCCDLLFCVKLRPEYKKRTNYFYRRHEL